MIGLQELDVENVILPLNGLKVEYTKEPAQCKSRGELDKNTIMALPDGRRMRVSDRFWGSWCSLHNLNRNFIDYFTHQEVFDRITTKKGNMVRVSIEHHGSQANDGTLLACTNPTKPILRVAEVRQMIETYKGDRATYQDGVVQASFESPFPQTFSIAGDDFKTRFGMQMPIDGYGLPSAYLELLRTVCMNGAVGLTRAFKTVFQLGKEDGGLVPVLERAMTTFNNEEGYHTFKSRLDAASRSWASFYEAGTLHAILNAAMTNDKFGLPRKMEVLKNFNKMTGNPLAYYGITSENELSTRKAKTIPVEATVYDLINFCTELGTHHLKSRQSQIRLSGWIGDRISNEYDLEGSVDTNPDFKDFFLNETKAIVSPERLLDGANPVAAPLLN